LARSRRLKRLLSKRYARSEFNLKSPKNREKSKEDDSSRRSKKKISASSNSERKHRKRFRHCMKASQLEKFLTSFNPISEVSLTSC
jgi:hypothetical protein